MLKSFPGAMMATIVKGSTISATVTAQLMSDMVELAAISNIDRTSLDTTKITDAYQAAVAPGGPYDRELWQASGRNGLSSYDVASAKWRGALPQVVKYRCEITAATPGMVLRIGGKFDADINDLVLSPASAVGTNKVVAVALAACAVGSYSTAQVEGPSLVKCTGTVNAGEAVKLSATVGTVQSAGAVGFGSGWEIIGTALSADSGGFVWINLRR